MKRKFQVEDNMKLFFSLKIIYVCLMKNYIYIKLQKGGSSRSICTSMSDSLLACGGHAEIHLDIIYGLNIYLY